MDKLCTSQQLYRPFPPAEETQILGRYFSNILFSCKEFELPSRLREGPSSACSSTQRCPGLGRRLRQLLWLFWAFTAQRHRQIPFCGVLPQSIRFGWTADSYSDWLRISHTPAVIWNPACPEFSSSRESSFNKFQLKLHRTRDIWV